MRSRTNLKAELPTPLGVARISLEIVTAIAAATGCIAALQSTAPAVGLGVLYLLAVLVIAIRHGQIAALTCALLSMLTLNYFFITPRHRLTIAHSKDVVELLVLLIVAVVVGRLAALGRHRAGEAETRARLAAQREREASLLAQVASAILAGQSVAGQIESIGVLVGRAVGASGARVALESAPSPAGGELVLALRTSAGNGWLYVTNDTAWSIPELERICEPLGRLIDVTLERGRVAEREAEAEAARRAEVARTAILHAISHDLRSPLTAITTAAAALRAPDVTEEERDELISAIEHEGARLAKLVDDLLDLSKIQAGAVSPQPDWCDLHDALASAVAHLQTNHPIEFALPSELPLVRADASQLERVFSNLLENAVRFSPQGSPVRVTAGATSERVTVRVIDRGRGIPSQHRTQVFEPFFRGRSGSGSGLGLAICRGFVEANGGQIILQSGTDEGTSFAVSFPVVPQPEAVG